ncbi:MAG: DUF1694 domain-containing protein [Clostridia bacterium]
MSKEKNKDSLEEVLINAYHGTPVIKPDEYRKFLGTFEERIIGFLLVDDLKDCEKHKEIEALMNDDKAEMLLINSKFVKELSNFINIANNKGLKYRVVSRKEGSTDVVLVIASNKALQNDNN